MPGVEDIMGKYIWGVASSRTTGLAATVPDVAVTTLHWPRTHPQLPAPQSSGPPHIIVHTVPSQDGCATLLMQLVGWQHWAGTQSASAVHCMAFIGVGAVAAGVAGTVTAGGDAGDDVVQPATRRAMTVRPASRSVVMEETIQGFCQQRY